MLASAVTAVAQAPPPPKGWAPSDKPAKTAWQPYPANPASPTTLQSAAAPPVSATPTSSPSGPIGSRVVLYTKPAGELRPVQATDVPAKPAVTPPQSTSLPVLDPDRPRSFALLTDDELFADKSGGRKSVNEQIPQMNASDQARYKRELDEYQKDPATKAKPAPPALLKVSDLQVSLSGVAVAPPAAIKPGYGPAQVALEPGYVVHRRLFFEEKNSERYGWDLGMAQPFISAAYFYKDALLWPAKLTSSRERFDVSAGKCPPGSPVPYYLYPPEITIRGGLWEAAAVVGVIMLLP